MAQVILERPHPKNTQFLYELFARDDVMRSSGLHKPPSSIDWRNIITGMYDTHQHNYLIMQGPLRVGYCGLQEWSKEDRRAEVTIAVVPEVHRQGIGKEALNQLLQIAAKPVSEGGAAVQYLLANIVEDNVASRKLFEGALFTLCSTIPVYHRFQNGRVGRCIYVKRLA